jgi:hypothetical protein
MAHGGYLLTTTAKIGGAAAPLATLPVKRKRGLRAVNFDGDGT